MNVEMMGRGDHGEKEHLRYIEFINDWEVQIRTQKRET